MSKSALVKKFGRNLKEMMIPSPLRHGEFCGIGIDLVSPKRLRKQIQSDFTAYGRRLLTPSENRLWKKRKFLIALMAKFLAAKEAFFKAKGGFWLGPDGFKDYEVQLEPRGRFRIYKKDLPVQGRGVFFYHRGQVGAKVIAWAKD